MAKIEYGPEPGNLRYEHIKTKNGVRRKFDLGTEDIIAIGCIFIALGILIGVLFGRIDNNSGLLAISAFASGSIVVTILRVKRK